MVSFMAFTRILYVNKMASEQTTSETKPSDEPRITYVGNAIKSEPKQKNPKMVAAGRRLAALRVEKKRLLERGSNPTETMENECESSAVNIVYIASIFGIAAGAIAIYKCFFTGKDDCPELQPAVHHHVERVADDPPSLPKPDIISLD